MPNWCENRVAIRVPTQDAEALLDLCRSEESDFTLGKIYPQPSPMEMRRQYAKSKYIQHIRTYCDKGDEWYWWRTMAWGTTQEVIADPPTTYGLEDGLTLVSYTFLSAWQPPIGVLDHLAKNNPELGIIFEFAEIGSDFWGTIVYRPGGDRQQRIGLGAEIDEAPEWIRDYWEGGD